MFEGHTEKTHWMHETEDSIEPYVCACACMHEQLGVMFLYMQTYNSLMLIYV